MDSKQQHLEKRVEDLEGFVRKFWERQGSKGGGYAYEAYVKGRCNSLSKSNKETAELAATSKAVGVRALVIASIGLVVGLAGLIFGIRSFFRS